MKKDWYWGFRLDITICNWDWGDWGLRSLLGIRIGDLVLRLRIGIINWGSRFGIRIGEFRTGTGIGMDWMGFGIEIGKQIENHNWASGLIEILIMCFWMSVCLSVHQKCVKSQKYKDHLWSILKLTGKSKLFEYMWYWYCF